MSGNERDSESPQAPPRIPAASSLVYVVILEKIAADPPQAKVQVERQRFQVDPSGYAIEEVSQLSNAVIHYVSGAMEAYRRDYEDDPQMFGEDPRIGGDILDRKKAAPKLLDIAKLWHKLRKVSPIGHDGHGSADTPYFALVTPRQVNQSVLAAAPVSPISALVSIEDFLKARGWWQDRRPKPEEIFAVKRYKCIGRGRQLHDLWDTLGGRASAQAKRAILTMHASPGVGKTYLLDTLMRKLPEDIPGNRRQFAEEVAFFVLNFSGHQSVSKAEVDLYTQLPDFPICIRLVYTECCDKSVSFDDFAQEVCQQVDLASMESRPVWALLRRHVNSRRIVVLVDEVLSSRRIHDHLPNDVRDFFGAWMLEDRYAQVLFSTLLSKSMVAEVQPSDRPLVVATTLPPLPTDEAATVALEELTRRCKSIPVTSAGQPIEFAQVAQHLATVSGGHARSFEAMLEAVVHGESPQQAIQQLVQQYSRYYEDVSEELLQAVMLGKTVRQTDKVVVDGTEVTYEELVSRGVLIDSFSTDSESRNSTFVPTLPEIHLRGWAHSQPRSLLKNILHTMLKLRNISKGEDYETFHILWENMMRELRPGSYACVELLGLYEGARTRERAQPEARQRNIARSKTLHTSVERSVAEVEVTMKRLAINSTTSTVRRSSRDAHPVPSPRPTQQANLRPSQLLHCRVDGKTRMTVNYFDKDDDWLSFKPEEHVNKVFKPKDRQNAGYDHFRVLAADRRDNPKGYILEFTQEKFSTLDASTKLDKPTAQAAYDHCKEFAKHKLNIKEFVVVFVCMRDITGPAIEELPANCIFLDRTALHQLYGPSLVNYLESIDENVRDIIDQSPREVC